MFGMWLILFTIVLLALPSSPLPQIKVHKAVSLSFCSDTVHTLKGKENLRQDCRERKSWFSSETETTSLCSPVSNPLFLVYPPLYIFVAPSQLPASAVLKKNTITLVYISNTTNN